MDPIRIGVIGASPERGWARTAHLPALHALPEYDVMAVCTSRQQTAEQAAQVYGARLAFWDYRELVRHPEVDAVTIAVNVPWHREMALAALAEGKHVYCEWPLAQTVEQGEEMAAAADRAGRKTLVGLQGRFAPWLRYLKTMVEDDTLGRVFSVNARLCIAHPAFGRPRLAWAAKRAAGAHVLGIQVAQELALMRQAFGEFAEVSARIETHFSTWPGEPEPIHADAPDCVAVHGAFVGGATLSAHFAYILGHPTGWRMEVYGERGTVVATADGTGHGPVNRLEGAFARGEPFRELAVPERFRLVPPEVPSTAVLNIAHAYRHFAQAIQDDVVPHPDFQDGLGVLQLVEALSASSHEGRTIKL